MVHILAHDFLSSPLWPHLHLNSHNTTLHLPMLLNLGCKLELPREPLKVDARATLQPDPLNRNLTDESQAQVIYKVSLGDSPGQQRQPLPHTNEHLRTSVGDDK